MDKNSLLVKSLVLFDHSYESMTDLYDKMSYSRNSSLCEYNPRLLTSGNIVKFHQYNMGKTQIIEATNEVFEIPDYRLHPEKYVVSEHDDSPEDAFTELPVKEVVDTSEEDSFSNENYVVPPLSDLDY